MRLHPAKSPVAASGEAASSRIRRSRQQLQLAKPPAATSFRAPLPGPDPGCRINRPLLSRQVHLPILPERLKSGDGGIRTPKPFRITCFRDRLPARLAHIPISAAHRSRTCKPVLPAHCLPDSSSTIEGLRRIVGRVGLEPTWPEGNGFTDRLLHSICISADIV